MSATAEPTENVAIVMRAIELFEREDWTGASRLWVEDAVLSGPPDWPEPGPFEGREAVIGQFQRLASDWDQSGFDDIDVVRDDGTWVVLHLTWRVQGAASGLPMEMPMVGAYRFDENRLITDAHFRRSVDEVLAVTGDA